MCGYMSYFSNIPPQKYSIGKSTYCEWVFHKVEQFRRWYGEVCDSLDEEGLQLGPHLRGLVLLHTHEQTQAKQLAISRQHWVVHTVPTNQLEVKEWGEGKRILEEEKSFTIVQLVLL